MTATHASATIAATAAPTAPALTARTNAIVLIAGAVIAVAANTIVAYSALAAGASRSFAPLSVAVFAPFSVLGFFAAYIGWRIIRRRSAHAATTLKVLVPVLAIVSYIPDGVLLATGFIPGASLTAVVGLALMHLVVIATVVPIAMRLAPVRA